MLIVPDQGLTRFRHSAQDGETRTLEGLQRFCRNFFYIMNRAVLLCPDAWGCARRIAQTSRFNADTDDKNNPMGGGSGYMVRLICMYS